MNKSQFKRNEWTHARLRPMAKRIDADSHAELGQVDDAWLIHHIDDDGVKITNPRTHHGTKLSYDQIREYMKDDASGEGHCFLRLKVQIYLSGNRLSIEPI